VCVGDLCGQGDLLIQTLRDQLPVRFNLCINFKMNYNI
jgi:hypothetical protein